MAAEEQDDEEQEDVLALIQTVDAPGSPRRDERAAGETEAETDMKPGSVEVGGGGSGGQTAGEIEPEGLEQIAGGTAEDERGETAETLWKDGPVWTVRSVEPEIDAAQRRVLVQRLGEAEAALGAAQTGGGGAAGTDRTAAGTGAEWAAMREPATGLAYAGMRQAVQAQAGLEGLYRQTAQAVRPAAPALPPEQAGRTARAQEPGGNPSLAVDELDRAVRRDSRRYDGGMSIF